MQLEFQGHYDQAIPRYEQVFSREQNTIIGRYALRKLKECFTNLNEKNQFDAYLNASVRPTATAKNELYALLVQFDNETLFDNKNYGAIIQNLTGLINDFQSNEGVYKQTLFDLGFLYLNSLNDSMKAGKYFSQLGEAYPNDLLVQDAKYLLGDDAGNVGLAKLSADDDNDLSATAIALPTEYKLFQNYPNPFNPTTTINYQIPKDGRVTMKVFDILGREVKTLVDEFKPSGQYLVRFDASHLSSGIYFYSLRSGNYSVVKKMMLLK